MQTAFTRPIFVHLTTSTDSLCLTKTLFVNGAKRWSGGRKENGSSWSAPVALLTKRWSSIPPPPVKPTSMRPACGAMNHRFPEDGIDQVRKKAAQRLGSDDDIIVKIVDDIKPARSGKYRPVISKVAEELYQNRDFDGSS